MQKARSNCMTIDADHKWNGNRAASMGPSIVLWLTIRNHASGAAPSRLSIPRRISPANQMRNKETVPCRYLFPASMLNRTWIPPLIIEPQTGVYFSNASTSVSDGIAFRYCSAGAIAHVCCVDRRGRQPRCGSLRLAPVAGWQGVQILLLTRLHAIVRHSMHRTRRRGRGTGIPGHAADCHTRLSCS